jgi:hypothetical protein
MMLAPRGAAVVPDWEDDTNYSALPNRRGGSPAVFGISRSVTISWFVPESRSGRATRLPSISGWAAAGPCSCSARTRAIGASAERYLDVQRQHRYGAAMTAEGSTVTLANGLTLSYGEQGDPAGPALVLLPGPTDSSSSYRSALERIPRSIPVVAVSQRGHGDSDKPSVGYAVEDFASDVVPLLDALRIERAVLAGHSGSCLATRPARCRPGSHPWPGW